MGKGDRGYLKKTEKGAPLEIVAKEWKLAGRGRASDRLVTDTLGDQHLDQLKAQNT